MSAIHDVDTAMVEVHQVEITADAEDDGPTVCACKLVLGKLLDLRLHLPLQRTPEEGHP